LAETSSVSSDPVGGFIDIDLPREVSLLWPQTWPAWIVMILLLVAIVTTIWHVVRIRAINRYRREALAELTEIEHADDIARSELLTFLTLLVRRTALTAFSREKVAALFGPAWLAFLDRSYGGHEFSQGVGRLLARGPYRQTSPDEAELQALVDLVRRWIRGHHA
jgi:Domain of unknown function (DUF4381)